MSDANLHSTALGSSQVAALGPAGMTPTTLPISFLPLRGRDDNFAIQ
jgi:hypothetical protein